MSKINYDALAVEGLKDVLTKVSTTCRDLNIDFFIVGAIARNIWLASHGENPTGTKDIDFGVYVPSTEKYNELKAALIEKYGYIVNSTNAFCLITPDGKQVDLLPFGEIEEEGQVIIEGTGLTKVNLEGFEEAYYLGATDISIGEENYKACSIPAVLILKMIAFDDRPEERTKDVKDINAICKYYPDIESNYIWEEHCDLYEGDREHAEVAMIALGRQMKTIIGGNTKLFTRIIKIIDEALNLKSKLLLHMIENSGTETLEMKGKLLEYIKKGLTA